MPERGRLIRHHSPLRYPGGKGRLAGFVQQIFKRNKLVDGHYAEPYAGGAAVALALLFGEYASHIYINDIWEPVYHFWKSALDDTDEICRLIRDKDVTAEEWARQREIIRNPEKHSRIELGYSMFFLNRTNRSGIVHTGGMIGGHSQSGVWKLDARFNKKELIARIESIARYRSRIHLSNRDAERFLATTVASLPSKALAFLDPPYFTQGQNLYENHYQPEDHLRIAELVTRGVGSNWIVSYDNHPEIRKAYKGSPRLVYSLPYSAARRYEGSEVMFFSDGLSVPRGQNPLNWV